MRAFLINLRALVVVGLLLYGVGWGIHRVTHWTPISIALGLSISVALLVAIAQFNMWATRRGTYELDSPDALEPYLRSWGQWLDERGRIVVRDVVTQAEFEFRKFRYATRPDQLVFRFRNADSTRPFFANLRAVLDRERVEYELELTPKTKQPRAIAVALDPSEVFSPLVAVGLAKQALAAIGGDPQRRIQVRADGRLRRAPDVPSVALVNVF